MAGSGISVQVKVDAARATAGFTAARRDVNTRMKQGLKIAGERVALPEARVLAPRIVKSTLVVRSGARSAYLTAAGNRKLARIAGLLEFGGTIRAPLRPRNAKALHFGGKFYAKVTGQRVIEGKKFLTRAVQTKESQITEAIQNEVMKAFDGFSS